MANNNNIKDRDLTLDCLALKQKDAYLGIQALMKVLNNNTDGVDEIHFWHTSISCKSYDVGVNLYGKKRRKYACIVKSIVKDDDNLQSELVAKKFEKLLSMSGFDRYFYIQIVNNKYAYVYDLEKLDMSKVKVKPWEYTVKQICQPAPVVTHLTLYIPYTMAIGKIDISEYVEEAYQKVERYWWCQDFPCPTYKKISGDYEFSLCQP